MKKTILIFIFLFIATSFLRSQLYQGPAAGSVASGVMVSTDNFTDEVITGFPPFNVLNYTNSFVPEYLPDYLNNIPPTGKEGSNFVYDQNAGFQSTNVLLRNHRGIPQTQFLPPDPSIASGPTHIVGAVNSTFRIWDKEGNILHTIPANSWVIPLGQGIGGNLSDPKVVYDHFSKRWIIAWITPPIGPFAYDVISVSDDSIPLGTWYLYAMRSDLNGNNPSGVWRDYEGVGYDNNAIYITGNGFTTSGSQFAWCNLRIINKAELYTNTGGPVSWFDIWDIRDPNNSQNIFGIRPSITYGTPNMFYLLCNGRFFTNTYVILYRLENPLTAPAMTGNIIPVVEYTPPPPSAQLGSSFTITSGGSSGFRIEPVYKNGSLYAVHAVGSNQGQNSSFKFYKLNTASNTADLDITYGAPDFYFSYPAISVDKDENVIVSYSRSATTQYIGAYYSTRLNTDPPNFFTPSKALKPGLGTYNQTGSSNRWGDYMGSWTDPADENNFWIMTQYAELNNSWGTWVGNVRIVPFAQPHIISDTDSLIYGNVEVAMTSDTLTLKILNYSEQQLSISNITNSNSQFRIIESPSYPVQLGFDDSIRIKAVFEPGQDGLQIDTFRILNNSSNSPVKRITLKGSGFSINPAIAGTIYGIGGTQSGGNLYSINRQNGNAVLIGPSNFPQLMGLAVRPGSFKIYATLTASPQSTLLKVNASGGDAYFYKSIPVANVRGIAFESNDILFCATTGGNLYRFDIKSGDTTFIGNTGQNNLYDLSINPVNNFLYGITLSGDLLLINTTNASTTVIGNLNSGFIPGIAFDSKGVLFATSGVGTQQSNIYTVNPDNASATLVGAAGVQGLNNLVVSPETVGIQSISSAIPSEFNLYQNYPNPFNSETNIQFDIPVKSNVKLLIYDITGKEIAKLVNEALDPGTYSYKWNAAGLSSGIYFYKLKTDKFEKNLKLLLLK